MQRMYELVDSMSFAPELLKSEVEEYLDLLRGEIDDPEGFHSSEEALHWVVLKHISQGTAWDAQEAATLAYSTVNWENATRWYA